MDEARVKRLIVATTIGAVMLAFILLVVMMYQLIAIGVKNKRIENFKQQIEVLDAKIASGEEDLAVRKERDWIIYEARKLGYYFEDDNQLG